MRKMSNQSIIHQKKKVQKLERIREGLDMKMDRQKKRLR